MNQFGDLSMEVQRMLHLSCDGTKADDTEENLFLVLFSASFSWKYFFPQSAGYDKHFSSLRRLKWPRQLETLEERKSRIENQSWSFRLRCKNHFFVVLKPIKPLKQKANVKREIRQVQWLARHERSKTKHFDRPSRHVPRIILNFLACDTVMCSRHDSTYTMRKGTIKSDYSSASNAESTKEKSH